MAAVLVGFTLVMIFQLFRWQVAEHGQMVALAEAQNATLRSRASPPPRTNHGRQTARAGRRHLRVLAVRQQEGDAVSDAGSRATASGSRPIINKPAAEIKNTIDNGSEYQLVATHIPQEMREVYDALDPQPTGFHLDITPKRVYADGPLASHVLGFVNAVHQGYYGLEQYYDARLVGEVPSIPADVTGRSDFGPVQPGRDQAGSGD